MERTQEGEESVALGREERMSVLVKSSETSSAIERIYDESSMNRLVA
jgi:hypothetical protein